MRIYSRRESRRKKLVLLSDVDFSALGEAGFSRNGIEHGLEKLLIIETETGRPGDFAVGVVVLNRQIANIGFHHARRQSENRGHVTNDRRCLRLNGMNVAVCAGYCPERNRK